MRAANNGCACERCVWWNAFSDPEVHPAGTCQRNAPTIPKTPGSENVNRAFDKNREWPQTHRDDWCGEFYKNPALPDIVDPARIG